jgi:hypothetical protein
MATLKGMWKSKTMWFNGLLLLVIQYSDEIMLALPQLKEFLGESMYKKVGLTIVVIGIVLRLKTTKALKDK